MGLLDSAETELMKNHRLVLIFAAWIGAFAPSANAATRVSADHWSVVCKNGHNIFTIHFDSPSGDVTNDDMKVSIESSSRDKIQVPLKPAWFHERASVTQASEQSVCNGIGAFPTKDGTLLIFLSRDNRPSWEQLALVLYDPGSNRVLDHVDNAGDLKSADENTGFFVLKTPDGFKTRLIRETIAGTSDGPEGDIEDWKFIHVRKGKLQTGWR
jgi:hypothetical protein